jgi:hypothetical protein
MMFQDLEHIAFDIAKAALQGVTADDVREAYCDAKNVDEIPQYDADAILWFIHEHMDVYAL